MQREAAVGAGRGGLQGPNLRRSGRQAGFAPVKAERAAMRPFNQIFQVDACSDGYGQRERGW